MHPLAGSMCKMSKQILRAVPKLWEHAIFKSKMTRLPWKRILSENILINLVPIVHIYLRAENKSQMSIH